MKIGKVSQRLIDEYIYETDNKKAKEKLKHLSSKYNKYLNKLNNEVYKLSITPITDLIQEAFDKEVDRFYDDYSPKYYNRNYNFYNALDIQTNNTILNWDVNSTNMIKDIYHDPVDYVLFGMRKGYHGTSKIHTTDPSPLAMMKFNIGKLDTAKILDSALIAAQNKIVF